MQYVVSGLELPILFRTHIAFLRLVMIAFGGTTRIGLHACMLKYYYSHMLIYFKKKSANTHPENL